MLARPLPATPFMSAAGLPLVIVGTLSVMIAVDSGDGQGGGGGVVRWAGEPWESGRGCRLRLGKGSNGARAICRAKKSNYTADLI